MAGSKMIFRWVVCFLVVGIISASEESSARHKQGVKGAEYQQSSVDIETLESVTASEVEYVDGPFAPLYDFLIQRRLFKFCKLLREAGLEQIILDLEGTWTLFAPTDASFIFLPGGSLEELQRDPRLLRDFLLYHFVAGDFPSNEIQNEMLIDSVMGAPLRFNIYGQITTVSGAQILEPDLQFELGRVYIVDRPLYPIPYTDIITYLQSNHKEIYRLLVDLNLADYISSGTFTFLAPEDDAFNYLSVELKEAIATNVSLAERIILNHILPGSVYLGGITEGMQWETVGGGVIIFTLKRGLTFANDIPIVLPDVPLTNGVIQVLNRVLLPDGVANDCHCKPSSDTIQKPGPTPGSSRPSFGQRPQHGQGPTTRRPGQSVQRQTPQTLGRQTPGPSISGQSRPVVSQNRPLRPVQSPGPSTNRPRGPSRVTQTVRPFPPPSLATRSPFLPESVNTLPDDDFNSVVGTGEQTVAGQKRPEQTRTTGYPPPPRRPDPTPRVSPQRVTSQPTRAPERGFPPANDKENYPPQEVTSGVTQTRQTNQWSNRHRTPAPRYPTPQQVSHQTTSTTRRTQTTRSYDWNQRRTTQSSSQSTGIDTTTVEPERIFQTQRPSVQTTSWQQRKQITRTTRQPTQRTTFKPPQKRPVTTRAPYIPPPAPEQISANEQTFESNRQQPTCRQQGERITPDNRNLPVCTVSVPSGCQSSPFDPSDARPLCPESNQLECRDPNDSYDPLDNRPLCQSGNYGQTCREFGQPTYIGDHRPLCVSPTTRQTGCRDSSAPFNPSDRRPVCRTTNQQITAPPATQIDSSQGCRRFGEIPNPQDQRPLCPEEPQQDCRSFLERPKPGDRRPLCSTPTATQTGCRDPSSPFNPSDRRPICRSTSPQIPVSPAVEDVGLPQGCRRSDEIANPQDQRPLCTEEIQEDCRSFLERPRPGDRRPVCKVNRQQTTSTKPQKDFDKEQKKPIKPHQQPAYPQRGQNTVHTTRRQSWEPTTRAPQSWKSTSAPQSWQSTSAPQIWESTEAPQSWQTTRTSQSWRPSSPQTTKILQNRQTTRASGSWRTTRAPQSWQTARPPQSRQTTRSPPSWQTTQTTVRQPVGKQPQKGPVHTPSHPLRDSFQTNTQTDSQSQSGEYPSQPQSGIYPSHPQPGTTGTHATQPQSGSYPSQPHTGSHPSQPQHGSPVPSQLNIGEGQFQRGRPAPSYPQRGLPQSQSRFTTPASQPQTPGVSRPGIRPDQPSTSPGRPTSGQGHQTGSYTPAPRRTTTTSRVPISVTGTSTSPGEDTRRTLYEIVEDPSLLIRGRPIKLTKVFDLFHKAGLEDILSGPGPTTVFLPSDDAFATLPQGVVEQLEENPELLRQVLSYHVTRSEILPSAQGESYTVPSLEGTQLVITMLNGGRLILISGAKAVAVTRANNGIFYVINQLLYPLPHHDIVGAIQSRPDLSTLAALLPISGLSELLQGQAPYTVLAPTDNAFAQLPQVVYDELTRNTTALQEILLNHVIEGAHYGREFLNGGTFPSARGGKLKFQVVSYGYQVNEINIKTPEIVTGTGVIHLVDQVILEDSDLKFFNALENSVAGGVGLNTNAQQPSVGGHQQGGGQLNPAGLRPVSGNNLPGSQQPAAGQLQAGGLQPSLGQLNPPVSRVPGHRQSINHQTTSGQSNVGTSSHGQQIPGRPSSFGGRRQPSTQGVGQPIHGQPQSPGGACINCDQAGQQPGLQIPGHQSSGQAGHSPNGGQQVLSQGQRTQVGTFVNQRQQTLQNPGHTVPGGNNQGYGTFQGGQPNDVAELARSMGLNQFANWISNTGLLEKVHDGGVYTVFAPTDDAVNSLPEDMVHSIDSNPDQVKPILEYHIVPQRVNLNSVTNEETASTLLQGKTIRFNVYQNSQPDCKQLVTASGTPVGEALATMGSIQVIPVTQVLYQPTGNLQKIVEASPILQKLNDAVKSARLTWILSGAGPVTIFAPSDTAFESLTEEQRKTLIENKQAFSDLLKRHMVRGTFFSSGIQDDVEKKSENNKPMKLSLQEGILTVNSIPVTYSDITATNGVLHVIDHFIL